MSSGFSIVGEPPPVIGQYDAARVPFEKRRADELLELADLHADGRLRPPHRIGSPRQVAGVGDREKGSEQIAVERS